MPEYDDIPDLASEIVGNKMAPKGAEGGVKEGAPSAPAEAEGEDPAILAAEDALAAFAANDAVALSEALKNHYDICAGKAAKSKV